MRVKWSDATNPGVTWEDREALRARFPHAAAWGQAASQGEGDVSDPDMEALAGSDPTGVVAARRPARPRKPIPRLTVQD